MCLKLKEDKMSSDGESKLSHDAAKKEAAHEGGVQKGAELELDQLEARYSKEKEEQALEQSGEIIQEPGQGGERRKAPPLLGGPPTPGDAHADAQPEAHPERGEALVQSMQTVAEADLPKMQAGPDMEKLKEVTHLDKLRERMHVPEQLRVSTIIRRDHKHEHSKM